MKIIIVGAGRIGRNLSKSLAEENHEVYLIEKDENVARKIADKLDVQVVIGNGADPDTLLKAQVKEADLVLAVTTSDETNLVVCSLASSFGAKQRIARVRNTSLSRTINEFGHHKFGINEFINPELVAARSIVNTIETPGAKEVFDFANGKILLRGFDVPPNSVLCGHKIGELRDEDFPWPFLIVSIVRDDKVIIPKGDSIIEPLDHIYALLPTGSLGEFLSYVNPEIKLPQKIVIYGASITGIYLAKDLSKKISDVTLLEENLDIAQVVAGELSAVRVINGSASEVDILNECGIEAVDVFIAASQNDHSNLISSVLAKRMGAKTTIITTNQPDYLAIVESLNIDAIINPHHMAVEQILRIVRGRSVSSMTKLLKCDAEALELVPEKGSAITRGVLKDIKFPKDTIIGAVYRDNGVILANGETNINEGENVIAFSRTSSVKRLQQLFTH